MTENSISLLCYNKGCGKNYNPDDNHADSCEFHPGAPFFHDAYKGWSCCNKKCTDFTEFLNFKGCTKAPHSNVKPAEPEKPKPDPSKAQEVIVSESAKRPVLSNRMARPSSDAPLARLNTTIASSLKQLLDKQMSEMNLNTKESGEDSETLKPGTSCKNGGCKKEYEGEHTNQETCLYHSGIPVFHEGMKFWSCCQRRTTDFETFLSQLGCTTGNHTWFKKQKSDCQRLTARYDWHQTGNNIIVTVYAKGPNPAQSYVEASPIKLRMVIQFAEGLFEEEILLRGIIDTDKSTVTMYGTKVEVKLTKAEFYIWDKLNEPTVITNAGDTDDVKKDDESKL